MALAVVLASGCRSTPPSGASTEPTADPATAEPAAGPVVAEPGVGPVAAEPAAAEPPGTYALAFDRQLVVRGRRASIVGADGSLVADNDGLIRLVDGTPDCPSDGFRGVRADGDRFAIEQQNCSGWYFINERLQFRMGADTEEVVLEEASMVYFDRRDPEADEQTHTLTPEEFGVLRFHEVELSRLYDLVE